MEKKCSISNLILWKGQGERFLDKFWITYDDAIDIFLVWKLDWFSGNFKFSKMHESINQSRRIFVIPFSSSEIRYPMDMD